MLQALRTAVAGKGSPASEPGDCASGSPRMAQERAAAKPAESKWLSESPKEYRSCAVQPLGSARGADPMSHRRPPSAALRGAWRPPPPTLQCQGSDAADALGTLDVHVKRQAPPPQQPFTRQPQQSAQQPKALELQPQQSAPAERLQRLGSQRSLPPASAAGAPLRQQSAPLSALQAPARPGAGCAADAAGPATVHRSRRKAPAPQRCVHTVLSLWLRFCFHCGERMKL